MSCSPFDLRDYFLNELSAGEGRDVGAHLKGCAACREELDRLRIAEAALLALRDEEIPQRIAFVSDKMCEPSGWRRWWGLFWGSGPRLGFASAAMLSAALLVSALTRPTPAQVPAPVPLAANVNPAAMQQEIDRRVNDAVAKVAVEMEVRQAKKTAEIVAAIEKRHDLDRSGLMLAMDSRVDYLQRKLTQVVVAANDYGPPRQESGVTR